MAVSIAAALAEAAEGLRTHGIVEPRLEAALLLGHILQRDRAYLIAHAEENISPDEFAALREFVSRRTRGEPFPYLTNHQEFFKLDFEVTPDVLIPRPESELIVEAALDILPGEANCRLVDIGTGSGCLAISILHERKMARALAIDISPQALQVARRNAERHDVSNRLRLVKSDLLAALSDDQRFDLIVSNPPYVSDTEMKTLSREVQCEPVNALAGGPDGISVIRRLLNEAPVHLASGGYFIFEIGMGQDRMLPPLIDERVWKLIEVRQDLAAIPRTVVLQRDDSGN